MKTRTYRICFLALVAGLFATASPAVAGQAKIISADDRGVKIGAGVDRGVRLGMLAEIYRQSAPLIHPVTGENLGSPKVKIARIEITSVGAVSSDGRFVENFAPVQAGDIVESIEVAPTAEDQIRASVVQTQLEIREIARSLAAEITTNKKAITDLQTTLRRIGSSEERLKSIANDVRNMRERMVIIEDRIVDLEDGQTAMIQRDSAEVANMADEMTELRVLRRNEAEEIHLKIGPRTYRLAFDTNTLEEVVPAAEMMMAGDTPDPSAQDVSGLLSPLPEEEEASPWYLVYWWIAPVIGVLGAVVIILLRFLKRPSSTAEGERDTGAGRGGEDGGFPEAEGMDDLDLDEFSEEIPEPEELEPAETEQ